MPGRIRAFLLAAIIALIALGPVFAVLAGIYLIHNSGTVPAFLPGYHAGSAKPHTHGGIACIVLAVLSWVAAFVAIRLRAGKVPASLLQRLPAQYRPTTQPSNPAGCL